MRPIRSSAGLEVKPTSELVDPATFDYVVVVGGLMVSQLLTLFITPVVYIWFDRLTGMRFSPVWAKRWRDRGRSAPATSAE